MCFDDVWMTFFLDTFDHFFSTCHLRAARSSFSVAAGGVCDMQ